MSEERTIILDHEAITRKLTRMAWEIYETNHLSKRLILLGIGENGSYLANSIATTLREISGIEIQTGRVNMDKSKGFDSDIHLECQFDLKNETVVMVDDVLNSGKTMLASMQPVIAMKPAKIQTAVLANRNHKAFPVNGDIVGISLATTLQEHIWFTLDVNRKMMVYLD